MSIKYKEKKVSLSEVTHQQLCDISKARKAKDELIRSQKDIVSFLVNQLHKKECK